MTDKQPIYAELPTTGRTGAVYEDGFMLGTCPLYTADQMRAFADATHALRAALSAQAPQPEAAPQCPTCNGHGAVGNILTAEPCPDCTSARWAAPQQAAGVVIDFAQVGTAGPFPVVDGRVSLPETTMQDLVRMLRPTFEAQAPQQEVQEPTTFHQVYRCKIKSRKQIDKEIPREQQGWWADVSAGQTLLLRQAVRSDLDRCTLGGKRSKNPDDYMCETHTSGSLVSKIALEYMNPVQNVFASTAQPAPSGDAWKDGDTAALVNELRDAAVQYRDTQQLREHIAHIVRPLAARVAPSGVAEDAQRWRMAVLIGNEVMVHPDKRTHVAAVKAYMDATGKGADLTGAVDAALKEGNKP